ncbi:hypothetical protein AgCh_030781 [Apium graveolens]
MKPQFEEALGGLSNATFMITNSFLCSANKFGIPRLAIYGMNAFSNAMYQSVVHSGLLFEVDSDDELFEVSDFPWITLTRNDFDSPIKQRKQEGPYSEFIKDMVIATSKSYGLVINSFYELEPKCIEYLQPKAWSIGPLCLAEPPKTMTTSQKPYYLKWLDDKLDLENGKNGKEVDNEFERRVKDRGLVVRDWVDQMAILKHESVKGFLSHCGWNSVLQSICAKVPILGWPMMAEQPLNVRMVVEEIKVGLRVETCDGTVRGFVKWEGLAKMVKELMEGEMGKVVRKNVEEIGKVAAKVVLEESGSSWKTLNDLIEDIHAFRRKKSM